MTEAQRRKAQSQLDKAKGAEVATAAEAAPEPDAPVDLDDPATQFRILNPEEMRYPLVIDDVVREIAVKTEFSLHDIHDLRVLDQLEAFAKLVQYEIAQVDGVAVRDTAAALRSLRIDIAMSQPNVRSGARNLLLTLSRFAEPFEVQVPGSAPVKRERPTLAEIALGIDPVNLFAASLYLVNRYYDEVKRRKNARGTAPAA